MMINLPSRTQVYCSFLHKLKIIFEPKGLTSFEKEDFASFFGNTFYFFVGLLNIITTFKPKSVDNRIKWVFRERRLVDVTV